MSEALVWFHNSSNKPNEPTEPANTHRALARKDAKTIQRFVSSLVVPVVILAFTPAAGAAGLACREFRGEIRLAPDPACAVAASPLRSFVFPDAVFLAELGVPNACNAGQITGLLGELPVQINAALAQTVNDYPLLAEVRRLFTAAGIFRVATARGAELGVLYLRVVALVDPTIPTVQDEIVVVAGSGAFFGAKGTLRISGNPFSGAAVSGTLCSLLANVGG